MAGFLSKGIKLSYKSSAQASTYTDLTLLQSIPDLGGDTAKVEVTTLDDAAHLYISGLKDYGDSLDFTFLYDSTQFDALNALTGTISWQITIPDAATSASYSKVTFTGECNVKLNGVGVEEAITYTLSIAPNSAMTWA